MISELYSLSRLPPTKSSQDSRFRPEVSRFQLYSYAPLTPHRCRLRCPNPPPQPKPRCVPTSPASVGSMSEQSSTYPSHQLLPLSPAPSPLTSSFSSHQLTSLGRSAAPNIRSSSTTHFTRACAKGTHQTPRMAHAYAFRSTRRNTTAPPLHAFSVLSSSSLRVESARTARVGGGVGFGLAESRRLALPRTAACTLTAASL